MRADLAFRHRAPHDASVIFHPKAVMSENDLPTSPEGSGSNPLGANQLRSRVESVSHAAVIVRENERKARIRALRFWGIAGGLVLLILILKAAC